MEAFVEKLDVEVLRFVCRVPKGNCTNQFRESCWSHRISNRDRPSDAHFSESITKYQSQSPSYAPSMGLVFEKMSYRA